MHSMGKVIFLLGVSGSGKTTICNILKNYSNVYVPTLITTRMIGVGEKQGEDYLFCDDLLFQEMLNKQEFLYYYKCHGHLYAIPNDVKKQYMESKIVVLGGSRNLITEIKKDFDDVVVIYINVAEESVSERLIARGRDTFEQITERLIKAQEMKIWSNTTDCIDYYIDNSGSIYELENTISNMMEVINYV